MNRSEFRLEDAREAGRARFHQVAQYVMKSDELAPKGDNDFRVNLYCSWILLTYAALEGVAVEYGKVATTVLGRMAETPALLPDVVRYHHQVRLVRHLASLDRVAYDSGDILPIIKSLESTGWSEHTTVMSFDGNVWPNRMREWLGRVGVDRSRLQWLEQPEGDRTETRESRVSGLVEERNRIAHGEIPLDLQSADLMAEWVQDIESVASRLCGSLQAGLAELFPVSLDVELGAIDHEVTLSSGTVAYSLMNVPVAVGDHVLFVAESEPGVVCVRLVKSIQSNGVDLDAVKAGAERTAITFNSGPERGVFYEAN